MINHQATNNVIVHCRRPLGTPTVGIRTQEPVSTRKEMPSVLRAKTSKDINSELGTQPHDIIDKCLIALPIAINQSYERRRLELGPGQVVGN